MFKFHYQGGKKNEKVKKISGLQNGASRGLQIGASFRDYKSGQEGLQIGATLGISNWSKKITGRGRDFKSGQRLQIGARGISNWGRDHKSVQNKGIIMPNIWVFIFSSEARLTEVHSLWYYCCLFCFTLLNVYECPRQ